MGADAALTREYSKRLGVLSGDQLQAACDRFDLGRLLTAEPVAKGLFGQNVYLDTTAGAFVLRGCPHADWQLPKERHVARLIHEGTRLEAPWPYHLESDASLFGWPYAIMHRIPGVVDGARGAAERHQLARMLGTALAELHALAADAPGYYDLGCDGFVPFPTQHEERVADRVEELRVSIRGIRSEALRPDDETWIDAVLAAGRPALQGEFRARFVHHDWKPDNVLCQKRGGVWTARGAVDLMEGYYGDPEEDLVRPVATLARSHASLPWSFLDAYRAEKPLRPGHAERYRVYQLTDCLVYWEYGQQNEVWFRPDDRFRDFARPVVDMIRTEGAW